jgi:hypothetical protein
MRPVLLLSFSFALCLAEAVASTPPARAPFIIGQPQAEDTVPVGKEIHLAVTAQGDGLRHQWLHNGTNIAWATNEIVERVPMSAST